MMKGMDLALKEFNSENKMWGRTVEIVYEDHQANPTTALSAFQILKSEGIQIINSSFSNVILALAPIANESEILLINSGATGRDLKAKGIFLLNTVPDAELEVLPLADYSLNNEYKTAGIIYVNYQFGLDQKNIFKENFKKKGGSVVAEEGSPIDSTDFRTALLKIKEKNPDIIFIGTLAKETALIIKQAKELGISTLMITTQTSISVKSLQDLNGSAEGLIISGPRFDLEKDTNLAFTKFKELYFKEYGEDPDYFATTYYDSTKMILQGIKKCGSADAKCVSEFIRSLKDFNGASGMTTFKGTTVEKPIDLKIFKNNKLETLEFSEG